MGFKRKDSRYWDESLDSVSRHQISYTIYCC